MSRISRLREKDLHGLIQLAGSAGMRLKSRLYYPLIFAEFGRNSFLHRPLAIINPRYIRIGEHVQIRANARLEAIALDPFNNPPQLRVGRNVNIEQNVHIVCHHRVTIEDNVSITANCSIVDTTHPFDDLPLHVKVGAQICEDDAVVEIGMGSFLGIGTVVLPNVRIGRGCVIGANSVVTRSIPDYSVAAGAPAVVLRSIRKADVVGSA